MKYFDTVLPSMMLLKRFNHGKDPKSTMKYAAFVVSITMQLIVFRDSEACLHQVSKTTGMPISAQKSWKRPSRMKKAATYKDVYL